MTTNLVRVRRESSYRRPYKVHVVAEEGGLLCGGVKGFDLQATLEEANCKRCLKNLTFEIMKNETKQKEQLFACPVCERTGFSGPGLANHHCPALPFDDTGRRRRLHPELVTAVREGQKPNLNRPLYL